MESCLYTGWVGHRRTAHAVNKFRYSLFPLYLLCHCEGGFEERFTGVRQLTVARPECPLEPLLPALG